MLCTLEKGSLLGNSPTLALQLSSHCSLMNVFTSLKTVAALDGDQTSHLRLKGTYLVVFWDVSAGQSGQKHRTGVVPSREYLLFSLSRLLRCHRSRSLPGIKKQKNCIYLRQIHISALMFHTVLLNGFKECVINVLFATWIVFLLDQGHTAPRAKGACHKESLRVANYAFYFRLIEGKHSGIKIGHEQQKFRNKNSAIKKTTV